jgi:hypothetical protein
MQQQRGRGKICCSAVATEARALQRERIGRDHYVKRAYSGRWQTASTLFPSGSKTKAPK